MASARNAFYITLLSGNSLDYFPNNTLSKFTVQLPYTLNLTNNSNNEKNDWYVGLSRYVHTSINSNTNKLMLTTRATGKVYYHVLDILFYAPEVLKEFQKSDFLEWYNEKNKFMKLDFKNSNLIQISKNGYAETLEFDYYGFKIPLMVKYTARELFDVIFSQTSPKKWSELKTHFKSFHSKIDHPATDRKFLKSCLADLNPNYICFYTDLIEPRIFGNKLSRALHMSPVLNIEEMNHRHTDNLLNVEYCKIEKKHVSEINILIADETAEQINFDGGDFNTLITLHFRKGI